MPSDHAKKRAAKKKEMAKGKRKGATKAEEPEAEEVALNGDSLKVDEESKTNGHTNGEANGAATLEATEEGEYIFLNQAKNHTHTLYGN